MIDSNTLLALLPRLSSDEKKECLQELARIDLSPNSAREVYQIVKLFSRNLDPRLQMHIQIVCNNLESQFPGQFSFDFLTSRQAIENLLDRHNPKTATDTPTVPATPETSDATNHIFCERCGTLNKETIFCTGCKSLMTNIGLKQSTILQRFMALCLDVIIMVAGPVIGYSFAPEIGILLLFINLLTQLNLFSAGTTLGKQIAGLQVVDIESGQPANLRQILLRETLGKAVSLLCFGLGFFWAVFDKNKQTWHDHASRSVVVSIEENSYDI